MVRFSFDFTIGFRLWEDATRISGNVCAIEKSGGSEQPVLDFFWVSKRLLRKDRLPGAAEFSSK